jgi:hypothetical protein
MPKTFLSVHLITKSALLNGVWAGVNALEASQEISELELAPAEIQEGPLHGLLATTQQKQRECQV